MSNNIVLHHSPPKNEGLPFWMQEDWYIARKHMTDAQIFYYPMRYLCVTPKLFEQVKALSGDCRCTYSVDGIEEGARVTSLRASFDKPWHENIATLFFWAFRDYAQGRRLDARLLRYPGLPTPATGTPADHWNKTIMPAVAALPKISRKNVLTCAYSYFRAFAGHEPLPKTPSWIARLLVPGAGEAEAGAVPELKPHIPPV